MQVWQFAAKRSRIPNWNVLYGSLKAYQWAVSGLFQNGTKRMETSAKRPTTPPVGVSTWLNQKSILMWRVVCPKEEMDKSMGWNELSGEWWNYFCKCLPPTVCKHAVSKSRPSSGNITAQHDTTPKAQHPTSPHKTDMTPFFLLIQAVSFSFWKRVMVVVLSEPASLMSLKTTVCLCVCSLCLVTPSVGSLRPSGILSLGVVPWICHS